MRGGKREGAGRPQKYQKVVSIRMNPEDHEELLKRAKANGMSIGDYLANIMKEA